MKIICFNRSICTKAIRDKTEIISIILESSELIINKQCSVINRPSDMQEDVAAFICINKMSRLFIVSNNKIQSFHFPFSINTSTWELSYITNIIPNSVIAILRAVYNDYNESFSIEDYLECIYKNLYEVEIPNHEKDLLYHIALELLLFEPGYVRYDTDLQNAQKAIECGYPHLHPPHHLDVNYTQGSTYKIGLHEAINRESYINMLDTKTNCLYLHEAPE